MKRIYFLLFVSFYISEISAQAISNGFYFIQKKDIGFQAEAFKFYGENKFAYISSSCPGTTFGKGSYEITDKDSLIMTFDYYDTAELHREFKMYTGIGDSLEIDLAVYEETEIPMPGSTVRIENDNEYLTDFDGKLNTIIKKPTTATTLKIMFVGMYPIEIKIPKGTTHISGKVSFKYLSAIPKKEKLSFKILQLKKSQIVFQSHTKSKTFLKVNQWKFARKVKKHMPQFYEKLFQDFFFSL